MANNLTYPIIRDRVILQRSTALVPPTTLAAPAGCTVVESKGVDGRYITQITVANFTQAIAGAALAFGKEIYDFPEGYIQVNGIKGHVTISAPTETSTPIIAFGSVVGSGAVAVLTGTSTFIDESISSTLGAITVTGTVNTLSKLGSGNTLDGHSSAKKMFMNFANTWVATENITIGAVLTIEWSFAGDN